MSLSLEDYRSDVGIDKWVAEVGVTDAPVPRRNLRTALAFFRQAMPTLGAAMAANFLRAMDLSRPVHDVMLTPADRVIAFRVGNESPFKLFYTRSGASQHSSGINPHGRSVVRFGVRGSARALESYTTGTLDVWTVPSDDQPLVFAPRANRSGVMVAGGGIQLIIPRSHSVLRVDP
ncbi:MAG TPA: hypothetical protein VMG12_27945 [Polyangiaceae bacterium]|nr:hypothetical protein [Polyangiaceae bacterium]